MKGTTHKAFGAAAALLVCQAVFGDTQPMMLSGVAAAGLVGGLIPDIDHPKSLISQKVKPVSAIVSTLFHHRGLFHAPLFYAALWAIVKWLAPALPFAALWDCLFIGIASHLLLDSLTPSGIPLFFPIRSERLHWIGVKTGGIVDKGIGLIAAGYVGICFFCDVISFFRFA